MATKMASKKLTEEKFTLGDMIREVTGVIKKPLRRFGHWLVQPVIINRIGQTVFFFSTVTIVGMIMYICMPYLFQDDPWMLTVSHTIGYFMSYQIFANWFLTKFVDTSYKPSKHGGVPSHLKVGQNISSDLYRKEKFDKENGYAGEKVRPHRKNVNKININNTSVMYVAVEMPTSATAPPKREKFPYFSWTPCFRCNRPRPPRCHHCPLCNMCVLKRDHHCFMTGACIGYDNLRYFSIFLFWIAVGIGYGSIHYIIYGYHVILPNVRYVDLFFPVSIIRGLFGYISGGDAFFIFVAWLQLGFIFWDVSFLWEVIFGWIKKGKTTFEIEQKINIHDSRDMIGKLRSVYGHYGFLNLIFPTHFILKPIDDPVTWPTYSG